MKRIFFIIAFSLAFSTFSVPERVRPIFIIDGDSFIAAPDSTVFRLWGVDAPELDQKWGKVARSALIELLHNRRATVEKRGESYGRPVVRVTAGGRDVALELLKMGLAWYVPKYAPDRKDYAAAHEEARKARRGLWSDPSPVSPEDHRSRRESTDDIPDSPED